MLGILLRTAALYTLAKHQKIRLSLSFMHAKNVVKWSGWLAVELTREETVDVCLIVLIRNALQGATSL